MIRKTFTLLVAFILIILGACNGEDTSHQGGNYEEVKKMVIDILQTEDGQKTLQKLIKDEEMRKHLIIESDVVQQTIHDVLTTQEGTQMWATLFDDPAFVQTYARSIAEEQKKLMKSLMNDAEFQKQMIEILQNPEISNQMLTVLKSQQYREHLEEMIQDSIDTPLFQAKMTEILLKVAEQKSQKESLSEEDEEEEKENEVAEDSEEDSQEDDDE